MSWRRESDREFRIAFEDLYLDLRGFAVFPEFRSRLDAIAQSAAVGTLTAFDGPGNTDEFSFKKTTGRLNDGVAVASHVDKRNVGG